MADGASDFKVRQRHATPARVPFELPPALKQRLERGKAELARPFKGVTTDGTPVSGLFRLHKTGLSLEPVAAAANAFLAGTRARRSRRRRASPSTATAWRRPGRTSIPS